MSDSPPPDDSIDDEIMTFDESLPNMDDDFPDDEDDDGPPDDDTGIDDGPPDDDMDDDGPPDDSMDDGPPDDSVIEDDDDDGPPDDDTGIDDGPPDDDMDDDGPPDDSFDDGPPDDENPDDEDDDFDDDDDMPPDDSLPPKEEEDEEENMSLPPDDETTLPPDSMVSDDGPPPSENESESVPPPSPSVDDITINDDDDDTLDEEAENKRKRAKQKARTTILSDGLDPKLMSSLASIDDNEEEESEDGDDDSNTDTDTVQTAPKVLDYSKRGSIIVNGEEYLVMQGKFEGDEFEELMVKVESHMLFVKTPLDENVIIPFDLGIDTKAKRDEHDGTVFYLNQLGQLITFQAEMGSIVDDLFSKFPPDTIVTEFEVVSEVADDSTVSSASVSSFTKRAANKGSSVVGDDEGVSESKAHDLIKKDQTFNAIDIDDPDFNIDDYDMDESGALVRKEDSVSKLSAKIQQESDRDDGMSSPVVKSSPIGRTALSPSKHYQSGMDYTHNSPENNLKGHAKRDVIAARMKKPKFSVRRMKQICNWVTSLGIWNNPITIVSLHSEFCNGILLSKLAKKIIPSAKFNVNTRALTEKAAIQNIELSLGVFWRTKCVNNSRIASAEEIYNGNINKTVITLQEIFEVYVVQPLFVQAPKMFRWYNNVLKQYNIPMPEPIFTDGDLIDLWTYVQSGFALFCVIHHLFGPVTVGEGVDMIRIDAKKIVSKPLNVNDYRENIKFLFAILKALKIPILYDLDDWLTYPDTEFIVYQLFIIYEELKHRQCSLPPAQGLNAGVTSGPNGDPIVTGMIFKDTPQQGQKVSTTKKKQFGVFLGGGGDCIQLLPIDTSGDADTVYRMVCPLGLMSTKVKIVHANVKAQEEKSNVARRSWDQSVSVEYVRSNNSQRKIDILKQAHTPTQHCLIPKENVGEGANQGNQMLSSGGGIGIIPSSTTKKPVQKKITAEELEEEMENLEHAMDNSQQEMEELEDELAVKYLELEQDVDRLGDMEYNSRFSFLEKERKALEKERSKLQDFFAQQLKNLRARERSSSDATGKSPPKSIQKDSSMNQSFYSAMTSASAQGGGGDGGRTASVIKKKKHAERGWNQFVNNNESHNNVFKQKNQSTDSSFLSPTKHSSYNVKMDNLVNNNEQSTKKKTINLRPPPTAKKSKDVIWGSFKGKLRDANIRWMSSKTNRRGHKIQELMTPKAPLEMKRTVDFNTVPKIHVAKKLDEVMLEPGSPAYIREEELALMKIEEARRWMVIQRDEEAATKHLSNISEQKQLQEESLLPPPPPPPLPGSPPPANTPKRGNYTHEQNNTPLLNSVASPISKRYTPGPQTPYASKQMPFFSPSPFSLTPASELQTTRQISSDQDFEAMLSWLAFPRTLSLKDRNSKKAYEWTIEKENMKSGEHFLIKWYRIEEEGSQDRKKIKPSTMGHPTSTNKELLEGFIYCQDILSAQIAPHVSTQLILRLSSTPRSLKSSGGRTVMTLVFPTDTECVKYCDGLNELLPSY